MQQFKFFLFALVLFLAKADAQTVVVCGTPAPVLSAVSDYTETTPGNYAFTEQLSWTATSPTGSYQLTIQDFFGTNPQPPVVTVVASTAQYNTGTRPFNSNRKITIAAIPAAGQVCFEKREIEAAIPNSGIITVVVERSNNNNNNTYTLVSNAANLNTLLDAALLKYRHTNPSAKIYFDTPFPHYSSFLDYDSRKAVGSDPSPTIYPCYIKLTVKITY
jgi:hypothetical protein